MGWSRPDHQEVGYVPKRGPSWATNDKTTIIGTMFENGSADTIGKSVFFVWTWDLFYSHAWEFLPVRNAPRRGGFVRNDRWSV